MPLRPSEPDHYRSGVGVRLCQLKLSEQPFLAGMKHLNRLEQVIARAEWQDEVFEGLMLSQIGYVIEATMANVFLVKGKQLLTPKLALCCCPGGNARCHYCFAGPFGITFNWYSLFCY